jgi:hypothetical protein
VKDFEATGAQKIFTSVELQPITTFKLCGAWDMWEVQKVL